MLINYNHLLNKNQDTKFILNKKPHLRVVKQGPQQSVGIQTRSYRRQNTPFF